MCDAAQRISLTASGQSLAIEGEVAITATDVMAMYYLPPIIARLREIAPMIEIEVIAANDVRDLARREADIAIRHARPEQPELIAKRLGEVAARLYASKTYLDRTGRPQTLEEASRLDFVGFRRDEIINHLNGLGLSLSRKNIRVSSASGTAYLALVREGLGVGVLTGDMIAFHPELEPVCPDLEPIPVPVWLVTHRELHTSRRIRVVFDTIAEMLRV
jgi:DNA-binding transcriptional LysR family regulator